MRRASLNHAFRLVFNRALGVVQVAPEFAKCSGGAGSPAKTHGSRQFALNALALAVALGLAVGSSPLLAATNGGDAGGTTGGTGSDATNAGGNAGASGSGVNGSGGGAGGYNYFPPGGTSTGGGTGGSSTGYAAWKSGGAGGAGGGLSTSGVGGGGGGGYANAGSAGGGGGGGGLGATYGSSAANSGVILGGTGGNGANAVGGNSYAGGGGGGGGGGGAGALLGASFTNSGTITGGAGGNGGSGSGYGGAGGGAGGGGAGVLVSAPSALTNSGSISGGAAGNPAANGFGAVGGVGVYASGGVTIDNSGTISGGANTGGSLADAIGFSGTGNTLNLQAGSVINGAIELYAGATATVATQTAGLTLGNNILLDSSGSALTVDTTGGDLAESGVISGAGSLAKIGAGILTLSGNNTYTGNTTVSAGTLQANGGNAIGDSSAVTVSSGATLALGADETIGSLAGAGNVDNGGFALTTGGDNSSTTFGGVISGTGSMTKTGTGTMIFTGDNTYTGGTTISAGTLQVNVGGTIGSNSAVTVSSGATLYLASNQTVGSLAGSGSLNMGAGLNTFTEGGNNTSTTFSGVISGANGFFVKAGSGTLTLSGANTFTGDTSITGGTLQVNGGSAIADTSTVDISAGATLALGADETIGSLSGAGNVNNGGFTLTAAGGSFAGVMSGTGGFTATGSLTLSGANTYTGNTTISGGTLQANGGNAIGDSSAVTVSAGATLALGADETIGSLAGAGNVNNGGFALTTGGNNGSTTFSGVISGAGSLTKAGSGTLILTGADSYSGGTTISAGTLAIGNGGITGSITGDITDNSALQFNHSDAVLFGGVISGTGSLEQAGSNVLALAGDNTYTGGTTISSGTLYLGNGGTTGSILGDVTDNGDLEFDRSDNVVFSGNISGSGQVGTFGGGNVTLTGTNTYGGGTNIYSGTLAIGNGGTTGSIVGNVADGGALQFNRSDSTTFGGVVSGTGSLEQAGSGTLVLTGNNTYTGGTTISAGTLQLGNGGSTGSLAGNVTDNGTLAFDHGNSVTFSHVISGSGGLEQNGSGTLTLTNNNTYSGSTVVNAGTLVVKGSLANSIVTVGNGASLESAKTIGGLVANSGSTVSMGSAAIGTLTVNGDANFNTGSTLTLKADAAGNNDLLNASGTVTLNGGTVAVMADNSNPWPFFRNYTVLTGTTVTGTFDGVTSNLAFLTPTLSYDASDVMLRLQRNDVNFPDVAANPDQAAVGNALQTIAFGTPSAGMSDLLNGLIGQSTAGAQKTLEELSGHTGANLGMLAGTSASGLLGMLADHRASLAATGMSSGDDTLGNHVWVEGDGGRLTVANTTDASGLTANQYGLVVGADETLEGGTVIGASLAQMHSEADYTGVADTASLDSTYLTVNASGDAGRMSWSGLLGGARSNIKTVRTVPTGMATGKTDTNEVHAYADVAYALENAPLGLSPMLGVGASRVDVAGYTETDAGAADLTYADQVVNSTTSHLGFRLHKAVEGSTVQVDAHVAWVHEFEDVAPTVTANFADAPATTFTVGGVELRRDAEEATLRVSSAPRSNLTVYVEGSGQWRHDSRLVAGSAGLKWLW